MTAPPPHHFDRGKPFCPLVINYVCQLVGIRELAICGIVGPRHLDELVENSIARNYAGGIPLTEPTVIRQLLQEVTVPLQLCSEMLDETIGIPSDAQDIVANFSCLTPHYFIGAAGIVFVMAHEISKDKPWHNHDPLWEFLRHCRNAMAYGGSFHFSTGEPRRPAQWGPFVLTHALHGTPLFKKDGGMLSPEDPVRLLWDIEQTYPAMTITGSGGAAVA